MKWGHVGGRICWLYSLWAAQERVSRGSKHTCAHTQCFHKKICRPGKFYFLYKIRIALTVGRAPWLTSPSQSSTPPSLSFHIITMWKHKPQPAANSERPLAYHIGFASNLLLNFTGFSRSGLLLILILFVLGFWALLQKYLIYSLYLETV